MMRENRDRLLRKAIAHLYQTYNDAIRNEDIKKPVTYSFKETCEWLNGIESNRRDNNGSGENY